MNEKFQWKAKRERKAFIALADGTVFHGYAFGEKKDTVGEAVFNTGMAGYKDFLAFIEIVEYINHVIWFCLQQNP